jgi:hypothetical protein
MDDGQILMIDETAEPVTLDRVNIIADVDFISQGVVTLEREMISNREDLNLYNLFALDPYIEPITLREWFFERKGMVKESKKMIKKTPVAQPSPNPSGMETALNSENLQAKPTNMLGG